MEAPHAIIEALDLPRAPSDTTRAMVLHALIEYGQAIQNPALAEAAKAAMPKAHPFRPPKAWKDQYLDAFRCTADEECGVDPYEGPRYCAEYWSSLTDADRAARLADPSLGFQDGLKDATDLNEV